jgi:hypothetical protein
MTRDARLSALHRGGFRLRFRASVCGISSAARAASSSRHRSYCLAGGFRASRDRGYEPQPQEHHTLLRLWTVSGRRPSMSKAGDSYYRRVSKSIRIRHVVDTFGYRCQAAARAEGSESFESNRLSQALTRRRGEKAGARLAQGSRRAVDARQERSIERDVESHGPERPQVGNAPLASLRNSPSFSSSASVRGSGNGRSSAEPSA